MSHNILCARASGGRCRCSCNGLLHGHLVRTSGLALPRYAQPTLAGVGRNSSARGGVDRGVRRWLRGRGALAAALTEVVVDGVRQSIDALPELDRRRLARSDHALCALLARTALHVGPRSRGPDGAAATGPAFTQALSEAIVGSLVNLESGQLGAVLGIAALVSCPDVAWHPEVRSLGARPSLGSALARLDHGALAAGPGRPTPAGRGMAAAGRGRGWHTLVS
jgi:hypothetical protein